MEKPIVIDHHQEQQLKYQKNQSLKCPRCDSSNTKFCYYNNYSLSQPRHFCKGCKRYWTRGGTLRSVPVGGGCRKNKRSVKTMTTTTTTAASTSQPVNDHNPKRNSNPNLDHLSSFYGSVTQNSNLKTLNSNTLVSGLDFSQPHQISNPGLRFSSPNPAAGDVAIHYENPSLFLSTYQSSVLGGSTSCSSTMASLLASGFQQPQICMDWSNHFHVQNNDDQLQAMTSCDPNSLLWNTTNETFYF